MKTNDLRDMQPPGNDPRLPNGMSLKRLADVMESPEDFVDEYITATYEELHGEVTPRFRARMVKALRHAAGEEIRNRAARMESNQTPICKHLRASDTLMIFPNGK